MRFAFGKNWQSFADTALTPERAAAARRDFRALLDGLDLRNRRFLDIGFGQGLALLLAAEMGAEVQGLDVDADNLEALRRTAERLGAARVPEARVASILDPALVAAQRGRFDVVHSWGVLHHTGDMWTAIANAVELVAPDGHFICSIYNRHWTSPAWVVIKWTYNRVPRWMQRAAIGLFCPLIALAKWAVTGRNPFRQERGMEFVHDVVDWVGGYPYEYASADAVRQFVEQRGFVCLRLVPARVPTGCNEFVFQRGPAMAKSGK